jgi:hypothetical protein
MDPRELWRYALVIVVAVGLVLHAVFPRYDWRVVGDEGSTIVVYDRWGGAFQRATWDANGFVKPTQPFKPF